MCKLQHWNRRNMKRQGSDWIQNTEMAEMLDKQFKSLILEMINSHKEDSNRWMK
jgi:hypothetical protein